MAQYTSITDEELVRLRKRDVKMLRKGVDSFLFGILRENM